MKLKDLFLKDVTRPIETVIKADDQDNILPEVEEYVITKEVAKKIGDFFSAYGSYLGTNGVWISGFFGSGKSHLLKILSYVLENKEYDGKRLGEVFSTKVTEDDMLKGDIINATKIPSESILFNIDQQAQITSKSDEDAILNVFYKVFNDHLGYFGAQRHVAEFERWLDSESVYKDFMDLYEENTQEHWTVGRRKYFAPKTKVGIAKSLGKIYNDSADKYRDIIETLQKDNRMSVEDFGEKVADYIQRKGHGFRLNFFIDEVGQFISENKRLMLSLQTIAETLATRCKGRSWIFATAQEDLEAVVGDQSAVGSDDFSKIQGRFKIRMTLTSANIDEVIEKRLLTKSESANVLLTKHWTEQQANLNTILSLSESGVQFRKFQGEKDYVNKFPFIPYQFDLFQQCIKELSKHNVFQGKHTSVGERSMLGVFQEVLRGIPQIEPTTLISFDLLFEGIRSTIRGEIQNAISLAERNISSEFNSLAVRVLKALFLVKYYTHFKTTARNVSVLMLKSTNLDLKEHEKNVQEALNLLENQTYIQRNGDVYEFLTDDEKDVEYEIRATEIDNQQITQFFNEIIFDTIIGDTRLRFIDNKQDYEFTKRIDGATVGRDKELIIEVLTPNSDNYGREEYYKSYSMGFNTLALFVLPSGNRLLQDIQLCLRTEKYYKQNLSSASKQSLQLIIIDKQRQNVERKRQLTVVLRKLLGESTVYMNGSKHDVGNSSDGKTKVVNTFQNLVKLAYPNLRMLGGLLYTEEMIKNIVRSKQDDLFGPDATTVSEAELEIYNFIYRRYKQSDRTSLSEIKDFFSKKPYGWYPNAILCITARLHKRGKIEARQDSSILSDEDLLANLLNNRAFSNTLLEPQVDFDQTQVKKLKDLYQQMFDANCPVSEARDIANAFKDKAKIEARELYQLVGNKGQYPFIIKLVQLAELFDRMSDMEYSRLIQQIPEFENTLRDQKENVFDPIRKFWNGEQKKIFDRLNQFIDGDQSNFEYVDSHDVALLRNVRNHPSPYIGNTIREAKETMDQLINKVSTQIVIEKQKTLDLIEDAKTQITGHHDFNLLQEGKRDEVLKPFDDLTAKTNSQRYISTLRQYGFQVQDMLTEQFNMIQRTILTAAEPLVEYIKRNNVKVNFEKKELTTEAEVEEYIQKLKTEMIRHIQLNRRIII